MAAGGDAIGRLHCRESGEGFPLVFIHGYLGGGAQWQKQLESPFAGMRIVAPCLPGFGDSADMTPPHTIGAFARLMLDFLAARNITRFFLLGHSMGGMIVQEMTRQSPERVAALILYGTGALGNLPGRFETMAESRRQVQTGGVGNAAARLPAKWLVAGENSPHYAFATEIAGKAKLPAHLAGLAAMEAWDGRVNLAEMTCPTLIVWGDLDQSYLRSQIDFLHANIPDATLKIISGASHLAHLEFPEQFDDAVHGFLRKLS